jgi:tyrocidine synthetase-3
MEALMSSTTQAIASNIVITNRFYPDTMPSFAYEPTREHFSITRIGDTVGEGVMTHIPFEAGQIIFGFTGFFSSEITQFSLQVHEGLQLHDPYFMGKVLHSCDPNAYCDMERRLFIALKPIMAGDFITMDYAQTEDYLFKSFPCECGAPNCCGIVKGRKEV